MQPPSVAESNINHVLSFFSSSHFTYISQKDTFLEPMEKIPILYQILHQCNHIALLQPYQSISN